MTRRGAAAPARVAPALRLAVVLALAPLTLGPPRPAAGQDRPVRERTTYQDLQMFSQVLNQIRVNHPDELDAHDLFMAAVEGLVRAADPHSYVIPYERLTPDREEALLRGDLVPLPLSFRRIGGAFVVVSVHPASDAATLDIVPGDELVRIDGAPIDVGSVAELDILLAGAAESEVVLELERRRADGSLARLERAVRRQALDPATAVPVALLLGPGTGYIRVTTFANDRAAADLHDALERLEEGGMERLVLDLRDNGGGLLDQAAAVAGEFLPRGTVVYTTEGRKPGVADTARVRRSFWKAGRDYPMAVLVDEGTASASEVVAGALQDHDRAVLVGRTTFGKALVMQGFPLTDGSALVLVVGVVRTPCGRSVQREYRTISSRDYYRSREDERERVARPSCTTASGRTVYGGGGIVPDRVLDDDPSPIWLARLHEQDLLLRWIPGFLEGRRPATLARIDDATRPPALPEGALQDFLTFARAAGASIPDEEAAHRRVGRALLLGLARAAGGPETYFRVVARTDPEVRAAVEAIAPDG